MRRAVEVVMDAGLGNEMFQYALGRTLAVRLRRPLVLDVSLLFRSPGWGYDLPCFRLSEHRVRDLPYPLWYTRTRALRAVSHFGLELVRFVDEPTLLFWDGALEVTKPCVLRGYWQSERYFESIANHLREEFIIVHEPDPQTADCLFRISSVKSIGVHVRRGDYIPTPGEEDYHGLCPKEYYDEALRLILGRLGTDVELFVFSDDMEWVRANIRYPLPTVYVDWNSKRDYEDLRLMSHCQALIIANSTFSWWAGWLNRRSDKLVVAPRRWYSAPGAESDLPKSSWITAI